MTWIRKHLARRELRGIERELQTLRSQIEDLEGSPRGGEVPCLEARVAVLVGWRERCLAVLRPDARGRIEASNP